MSGPPSGSALPAALSEIWSPGRPLSGSAVSAATGRRVTLSGSVASAVAPASSVTLTFAVGVPLAA